MSDIGEALEGGLALIVGGVIFLLFAGAVGGTGLLDFTLWGFLYIAVGVLTIVTLVAAFVGAVLGEGL